MSLQTIRFETPPHSSLLPLRSNASTALAVQAIMKAAVYVPGAFQQFVYFIPDHLKTALTIDIFAGRQIAGAIVYVKTNFAAGHLAEELNRAGVTAESFHNNKSQRTRVRSLTNFRDKATRVLVATESAASAIAVSEITTIINYDLPVSAETYIKRLSDHGNVATPLAKAFSFCNKIEQGHLANINRALGGEILVLEHCLA
jgi:ATP-dependent RNA helicase RhlE